MSLSTRPLKCLIVDDEPLARKGIEKYIAQVDFLEHVAFASNPVEVTKLLREQPVDIIFLDIQMPLLSGIEFLKMSSNLPMVIVTTAFPSYALDGYELDVVDYLLKPISFNRFFKAVYKARDLQHYFSNGVENESSEQHDQFFFIKCNGKYEKISFDRILFVEAMQNYVNVYTENRKYTTLLFLKTVEESLPSDQFLRIHRSYIISLAKVDRIDIGELIIGDHRLPISRRHKNEVHERVVGDHLLH
ncbi:MAG: LytTR family DNA-binding domain-containing protein [Saprospiraceae bacterium]|nr:LytTR family DNA-binding domain-containing protein [Saprospiraceae bacterium]